MRYIVLLIDTDEQAKESARDNGDDNWKEYKKPMYVSEASIDSSCGEAYYSGACTDKKDAIKFTSKGLAQLIAKEARRCKTIETAKVIEVR